MTSITRPTATCPPASTTPITSATRPSPGRPASDPERQTRKGRNQKLTTGIPTFR